MTEKVKKIQDFLVRYSDEKVVECIIENRPCDIERDIILNMSPSDKSIEVQFVDTETKKMVDIKHIRFLWEDLFCVSNIML